MNWRALHVIPAEVDSLMEHAEHELDYYPPGPRAAGWREIARQAYELAQEADNELRAEYASTLPFGGSAA